MNHLQNFVKYVVIIFISQLSVAQYTANDWADRDTWMDVHAIFDEAGVEKGSFVADIGCHEGYLSIHLAKRIGSTGKVFAVDVREDSLEIMADHLKDHKLSNVTAIHGDYDNPKLPVDVLDVVIIMDTYHEMEDYMVILNHVRKSLKSGGKIVIVEKLKSRIKGKSRAAQTAAHSISMKYVRKELRKAGFKELYHINDLGNWENDSDKVIWMLIAEKE